MTAPSTHPLVTAPQLGQILVSTRKRLKLTQAEVASRVGLSQNRISLMEKHPDEISVRQLLSWCAFLKLDLADGEQISSPSDTTSAW